MSEQDIQKAIAAYLDTVLPSNCWFTAVNPVPMKSKAVRGLSKAMGMKAGAPDFMGCVRGRLVGIEVKTDKGRPSAEQERVKLAILLSGGVYQIARSVNDVEALLTTLGVELRGKVA